MKKCLEVLVMLVVLSMVFPFLLYAQGPIWEERLIVADMVNYQIVIDRLVTAGWKWTGLMEQTPTGHIVFVVGAWVLRAVNSVPIILPVPYWQFQNRQPDV